MGTLTLAIIICVPIFAVSLAWTYEMYSDDSDSFILPLLLSFAAGLASVIFIGMRVSQHYDRVSCRNFARQTNRDTRFVFYNGFSWDCLTRDGNGKWIPTKNLREFGSGG